MNWDRVGRYAVAIAAVLGVLFLGMMLNLTGDCSLEVRDCGEDNRRLSFIVLGAGGLAFVYLAWRFIRGSRDAD